MKTAQNYVYAQVLLTCLCCGTLVAVDSEHEDSSMVSVENITCSKETLMTFFPRPVVKAVLMQNKVSEEEAQQIAQELSQKDQEVVKQVEVKASEMNPNPFSDLAYRNTAIKLFRETLYEVFAKVLKAHQITDENQIQHILEDMQAAKGKLFVECIKKEYPVRPKPQTEAQP